MRVITRIAVLALVVALGYLVYDVAEGAGDWLVFAAICLFTFLIGIGLNERRYPASRRKRSLRRGADSRW